jgi:hypothetical protein
VGNRSQLIGLGYGFGIGPESGVIHVGGLINLGYVHLWDNEDYIHGLHMAIGPLFMGSPFWYNWHFTLALGWNGILASNVDIPDGRGFSGFFFTLGVGTTFRGLFD